MDGPEDLSIAEFVNHPSFRQIATFFLGFVFISCIHYTYRVPVAVARRIRSRCLGKRGTRQGGLGLEANRGYGDEKVHGWLGYHHSDHSSSFSSAPESNNLALSLTICFAMASIAEFGSLLVFSNKGQAGCAFLVAWGGMAAQAARLLGLLKLSLDLKKMGVHKWETFIFWGWLVFALVMMFVSNAISIGTIKPIPQMSDSSLCFRRHFVATAAVSSIVDVLLEVYCLIRINYLLVPAFLSTEHKFNAVLDVRTSRALSLLILDITSAVPAAKFFSVLADVIPASIATLLVLAAFNRRSPDISLATTASIPPTRQDSLHSRSTIEIKKMPSTHSLADRDPRVSHPFAAIALQDPSPETEDWPASASPDIPPEKLYIPPPEPAAPSRSRRTTWRTSNQSSVSESDSEVARSVKGAIVAFAFRDQVGHSRKTRERRSFLPAMPSMSENLQEQPNQSFPRSTPLRIPKPIIPPALRIADLERASDSPLATTPLPAAPRPGTASSPRPQISITTATPVTPAVKPPSTESSARVSLSAPSNYSNESAKSLHLTPSTPARSYPSHRVSSESNLTGEWRYDSRHDSLASSHRSSGGVSPTSPTQAHRQSGGSARLPPADDDLSIVYEASHEDSESIPPSRAYRPTFGEHMFVQGGLGRPMSPPPGVPQDVPQDVRPEEHSSGSAKSVSSHDRI